MFVVGRLCSLVALLFVGMSAALFCFVVVGAVRKEFADQEDRLAGRVYTAEELGKRSRRRRQRGLSVTVENCAVLPVEKCAV